MRLAVGLVTVGSALVLGVLTLLSIKAAGGLDILSVTSLFVVLLFLLAGIGALRSER